MRNSPPFRTAPGAAEGATLAVEAATPRGSVALARDGAVLSEVLLPPGVQVSASYVPALSELFARAGDVPVARVAVSAGPGSFTGLRVGLSAAKGICLAAGLPAVPVPTLEALALCALLPHAHGHGPGAPDSLAPAGGGEPGAPAGTVVCPVLDARKKEVYCAAFAVGPRGAVPAAGGAPSLAERRFGLRRLLPDGPRSPEAFLALLPAEVRLLLLGDGVDAYGPLFHEALGGRARLAPPRLRYPRACAVALLGEEIGRSGGDGEAGALLPAYLRRSEAEEAAAAGRIRTPF